MEPSTHTTTPRTTITPETMDGGQRATAKRRRGPASEQRRRSIALAPLDGALDDPLDFEQYARSRLQDFAKR